MTPLQIQLIFTMVAGLSTVLFLFYCTMGI